MPCLAGALFVQVAQGGIEHADHVVQVLAHLALQLGVFDLFQAQLEARERGAQVVGDRAEHACALADLFADALLHQVEGRGRLACFARAGFHQGRAVEVDAQALGRCAQALDWPAQQFGAVPGSDDQRDKLKCQGHHRAAEPGARRFAQGREAAIWLFDEGRAGWWRRAVVVEPEERQHMGQHNRHQQQAEQSPEQRVEGRAHQPISRASNR